MHLNKRLLSFCLVAFVGAGCITKAPATPLSTNPLPFKEHIASSTTQPKTTQPSLQQTSSTLPAEDEALRWHHTVLQDPKNTGHSLSVDANDGCIYLEQITGNEKYSPYATNLFDLLANQKPISDFSPLDTGTYTSQELVAVNKVAQEYSRTTAGGELQTYITCKLSSRTQGPAYLVIGTYLITGGLKERVHALEKDQSHIKRYANWPGKSFLVITPRGKDLIVRRDLFGVTAVSPVGREDLGPCSGELVQEYKLVWRCDLSYVENKDHTFSLRTRTWIIHLDESDPRRDSSSVTEENVGTMEKNGPFFFYGYPEFEKDIEPLEWNGNEWKISTSTSRS